MSDSHGNTPAAWSAVFVALLGFVVGGVALMLTPVSMVMFWLGVGIALASRVVCVVLATLGFHASGH